MANAGQGEWTDPPDEEFVIYASVQPLDIGEAAAAADVTQGKDAFYVIYDIDEPRLRSVEDSKSADYTIIDGNKFEAVHVAPWRNGLLPHYKVLIRALTPMTYGGKA